MHGEERDLTEREQSSGAESKGQSRWNGHISTYMIRIALVSVQPRVAATCDEIRFLVCVCFLFKTTRASLARLSFVLMPAGSCQLGGGHCHRCCPRFPVASALARAEGQIGQSPSHLYRHAFFSPLYGGGGQCNMVLNMFIQILLIAHNLNLIHELLVV